MKTLARHTFVICGILMLLFSSCGRSTPSRFYVLTPLADSASEGERQTPDRDLTIGVGPVSVPDYLDKPYIVTRTGPNQIRMADFDKWAGALKRDIPRILAENLSGLLKTEQVVVFPWRSAIPIRYQVVVDVVRFDAEPEGNAVLDARWTILGQNGRKVLTMRKSRITVPTEENGYGYKAIVSAQSRALAKLSKEIADTVTDLSGK